MRTVLITGAGSLIGEATAQCLISEGWHVIATDLDLQKVETVATNVNHNSQITVRRLDVTRPEQVGAVVADIQRRFGPLGALVNVAGGGRGIGIPLRDFVDFSVEERNRMLSINVHGVLNCTHAVLPAMIKARKGSIVSITAARGLKGGPRASTYSASKAGIIAFTQSLAQEVGPAGVRVNTVAPGNTPARWKDGPGQTRSPLGRPTSPEDVGNSVAFLLSDKAEHITGICLDVSGGTALH